MEYSEVAELVREAKLGDRNSFQKLYSEHYRALYKLALSMVHNVDDTQDLIQETFVIVYRKLHTLRENQLFKAWTTKILVNQAYKLLKYRASCVPYSMIALDQLEVWNDNLETTEIELLHTVNTLRQKDQLVIKLRFFAGLRIKEIAKQLNCSENTTKSRLYRAIEKLKKECVQ